MKKVLITGFEPFQGELVNPSELLVKSFKQEEPKLHVDKIILPVSFSKADNLITKTLGASSYDFVLLMGQAKGREFLCLERFAINLKDNDLADEDGVKFNEELIVPDAAMAIKSTMPVKNLVHRLGNLWKISDSAGSFVCNAVYYKALFLLATKTTQTTFIHLPCLPEQTSGACMAFNVMEQEVNKLVKILSS